MGHVDTDACHLHGHFRPLPPWLRLHWCNPYPLHPWAFAGGVPAAASWLQPFAVRTVVRQLFAQPFVQPFVQLFVQPFVQPFGTQHASHATSNPRISSLPQSV